MSQSCVWIALKPWNITNSNSIMYLMSLQTTRTSFTCARFLWSKPYSPGTPELLSLSMVKLGLAKYVLTVFGSLRIVERQTSDYADALYQFAAHISRFLHLWSCLLDNGMILSSILLHSIANFPHLVSRFWLHHINCAFTQILIHFLFFYACAMERFGRSVCRHGSLVPSILSFKKLYPSYSLFMASISFSTSLNSSVDAFNIWREGC